MALAFTSRRSPVFSIHGCVASSQPLATDAGRRILEQGGNAADAAVAVAAALNVTEPCSTGIGGDCFCLYFDARTGRVRGLNGSGRAPAALTVDAARAAGAAVGDALDPDSAHCVTVPGAAAGWCDAVAAFGSGRLKMAQVLAPAIALAEGGFPVGPVAAHHWARGADKLRRSPGGTGRALLVPPDDDAKAADAADNAGDGEGEGGGKHANDCAAWRAPRAGEVFANPDLARTFRALAGGGKAAFYGDGARIAEAVVACVRGAGGLLSAEDLIAHKSTFDTPIRVRYRGKVDVWEMPPNGQGITALIALNLLERFDVRALAERGGGYHCAEHLHVLVECMRLAFADARWYVADPRKSAVPSAALLSKRYAAKRAKLIRADGRIAGGDDGGEDEDDGGGKADGGGGNTATAADEAELDGIVGELVGGGVRAAGDGDGAAAGDGAARAAALADLGEVDRAMEAAPSAVAEAAGGDADGDGDGDDGDADGGEDGEAKEPTSEDAGVGEDGNADGATATEGGPGRALTAAECGKGDPTPFASSDTVYFSVVDGEGNACSFINSNYMGFGTGLVPEGCGFTLQNRGANFSLEARQTFRRAFSHIAAGAPESRAQGRLIPC